VVVERHSNVTEHLWEPILLAGFRVTVQGHVAALCGLTCWGGVRVPSQGHLPAESRPAVPTRLQQCGGLPIHHARARRAHPTARPPPDAFCDRTPADNSMFQRRPRYRPLPQNHTIYQAKRSIDKPLHINTATALACRLCRLRVDWVWSLLTSRVGGMSWMGCWIW
jgi:hypothetical protein